MPTSNQQLPQVSVLINQLAENLTLFKSTNYMNLCL